jgi:hypothetical protein
MIYRLLLLLATLGVIRAAEPAKPAAASTEAPASAPVLTPAASLDAFRLIIDRNIFNANRTGRRERSEAPAPRLDTITLVGTMDYEKGEFAFFDGSDADSRKALRVGQSIAQFTVTKITNEGVELERGGKPLKMAVRQQLRRSEGGDWSLDPLDTLRPEAASASNSADTSAAPAAIPADASDVVRRMMEQRQKQLRQ